MKEAILDPKYSFSQEVNKSPFNMAYKTDLSFFDWLDVPERKEDLMLVAKAMEGAKNLSPWDDVEGAELQL